MFEIGLNTLQNILRFSKAFLYQFLRQRVKRELTFFINKIVSVLILLCYYYCYIVIFNYDFAFNIKLRSYFYFYIYLYNFSRNLHKISLKTYFLSTFKNVN